MRNVEKILRKANKLLAEEKNWIQKSFARNKFGVLTSIRSEDACAFCLSGAITRAAASYGFGENSRNDAIDIVDSVIFKKTKQLFRSIIPFNDHPTTTLIDVKDVLAASIKRAAR